MKTISKTFSLPEGGLPSGAVFLDIETTGFSAARSMVYLTGACFAEDGLLQFRQWFAEAPSEEETVLSASLSFLRGFSRIITFNGSTFDLPFLQQRAGKLCPDILFPDAEGLDLYRRFRPLKEMLRLPDCRQKTLESYLGIAREDRFSGGDLIRIYLDYAGLARSKTPLPREEAEHLLLLHNEEDVLAMPSLLPLLACADFREGHFAAVDLLSQEAAGDGASLIFTLRVNLSLPQPVLLEAEGISLYQKQDLLRITVPALSGELFYFFPDYRNYWYLPKEDMAIHKSVASFVEKEFREKARPETAYQKKSGEFFRIPRRLQESPVFYEAWQSPPYMLFPGKTGNLDFWTRFLQALLR